MIMLKSTYVDVFPTAIYPGVLSEKQLCSSDFCGNTCILVRWTSCKTVSQKCSFSSEDAGTW